MQQLDTVRGSSVQDMLLIPGGRFIMGSDSHYPEERPAHPVAVSRFWIDTHQVSNGDFAKFVAATGYLTFAEREPDKENYPGAPPELLLPGSMVFDPPGAASATANTWWRYVAGAHWRQPEGPGSTIAGREDLPVVHVTADDAAAYAAWAGKSLPTEAQWEFAARGGLNSATYAWGEEFAPGGRRMANTWEGAFPYGNSKPHRPGPEAIGSYPANGYGLYDMIGNVWEWTQDWYQGRGRKTASCCIALDPRGGTEAESVDPRNPEIPVPRKVIKGGSFLCAPDYCMRYRPAARQPQAIDTPTCNVGFRCVVNENQGMTNDVGFRCVVNENQGMTNDVR